MVLREGTKEYNSNIEHIYHIEEDIEEEPEDEEDIHLTRYYNP